MAGVAFEGGAVEVEDVADDASHRRLAREVGQHLERLGVRHGQDVALLDPGEAVDGRPVEGHPLFEGVLQLGRGDVERLGDAEHVGEPQLHEADAAFLHGPQHVVLLGIHSPPRPGHRSCAGALAYDTIGRKWDALPVSPAGRPRRSHRVHTGATCWPHGPATVGCRGGPTCVATKTSTERGNLPWPSRGARPRRSCRWSSRRGSRSSTSASATCPG